LLPPLIVREAHPERLAGEAVIDDRLTSVAGIDLTDDRQSGSKETWKRV